MAANLWMLELGRTAWRLHACRDEGAPSIIQAQFTQLDPAAQALGIHGALVDSGYLGEPIIVVLASTRCLSATLPVLRPKEFRDRQTMLYRLEECIPWSAEDCVGDFSPAGSKALMVAVLADPLAGLFAELEKSGVHVQSIVPKALLAAAEHVRSNEWPVQHVVAFRQDEWIDLLFIDAGKAVTWSSFPVLGPALRHQVKSLVTDFGIPLPFVGYDLGEAEPTIEELHAANVIDLHAKPNKTHDNLASAAAKSILRGELDPPVELKRGAFGRKRGNAALRRYSAAFQLALGMLLLVTAGALLWSGHLAGRQADLILAKQVETFRKVFANTKVPIGIRGRLDSELTKLKGLQGDDTSLPNVVSAIAMLRGLLDALPPDRRFRLLEIRIEDGRLYVDAEVREHGDAEAIALRLRSGGFEVASPRTQRMDDKRVSLRISATMLPAVNVASRKSS